MGASNPHPHGQIWASRSVPNEVAAELHGQREYFGRANQELAVAHHPFFFVNWRQEFFLDIHDHQRTLLRMKYLAGYLCRSWEIIERRDHARIVLAG